MWAVVVLLVFFVAPCAFATQAQKATTKDDSTPQLQPRSPRTPNDQAWSSSQRTPQKSSGQPRSFLSRDAKPDVVVVETKPEKQVGMRQANRDQKVPPLPKFGNVAIMTSKFNSDLDTWLNKGGAGVAYVRVKHAKVETVEKIEKCLVLEVDVLAVLTGSCALLSSSRLVVEPESPLKQDFLGCSSSPSILDISSEDIKGKEVTRNFVVVVGKSRAYGDFFVLQGAYSDFTEIFLKGSANEGKKFPFCRFADLPSSPPISSRATKVFSAIQKSVTSKALDGKQAFIDFLESNGLANPFKHGDNSDKFYKSIRDAKCTINFRMDKLGAFAGSGRYKNAFELSKTYPQAGLTDGRSCEQIYKGFELPVPKLGGPGFAEDCIVQPKFMALNMGQSFKGGAPGYGSCVFVLKDDIKARSVCFPVDTLYVLPKSQAEVDTITSLSDLLSEGDKVWLERLKIVRDGMGLFTDNGLWRTILSKFRAIKARWAGAKTGDSLQTRQANMLKEMTRWITGILNPSELYVELYKESSASLVESIFEVHTFLPISLSMVESMYVPFDRYFGSPSGMLACKIHSPALRVVWYYDDFKAIYQPDFGTLQYNLFLKHWDKVFGVREKTSVVDETLSESQREELFTELQKTLPPEFFIESNKRKL